MKWRLQPRNYKTVETVNGSDKGTGKHPKFDMVFVITKYRCKSWTLQKASKGNFDLFALGH